MTINVNPVGSKLQMRFEVGIDDEGKPIITSKTFNSLKPDAVDEDVYVAAQNLAELQISDVKSIRRIDETELTEVEE
ncbi:MAG TPA: DUF1659 domain-containing protein [Thermoanaerobacterales bacterium]|nr:DUF1659 domain-containing protein [Thermoanaerobacterales bacterium]